MSRVFGGCRALMAAAKAAASSSTPAVETTAKKVGIMKPVPVSPAMRKFLGVPEISRAEAVKKIWEHIKAHDLQGVVFHHAVVKFIHGSLLSVVLGTLSLDRQVQLAIPSLNPANKKEIHCDEKLKSIFDGKEKVGMLEIARLLSPHFLKSK